MATATRPRRGLGRPARPLACLLAATIIAGPGHSYSPSIATKSKSPRVVRTSTCLSARLPPRSSNWEDDFSSSRRDGGVSGDKATIKPAWQENAEYWAEREALEKLNRSAGGGGNVNGKNKKEEILDYLDDLTDGGNTFARMYVPKSTDEFKKPYDPDEEGNNMFAPSPPPRRVKREKDPSLNAVDPNQPPAWFGSNERQVDNEPKLRQKATKESMDNGNAGNSNRHAFQMSSTDDFRKPHGSVPGISGGNYAPPPQARSFNPDVNRHPFQMSSTDEFRRPHGMPPGMEQRQPPRVNAFKAPFQTSTTADFKRSSDVASGVGAPQNPMYQGKKGMDRLENPAWKNGVGKDTYGSTLGGMPPPFQHIVEQAQNFGEQAQNAFRSMQPPKFTDATIIDDRAQQTAAPVVSQSSAPMTDFEEWDQRLDTARSKSSRTMMHGVRFPLARDPPGVCRDHPSLAARVLATTSSTLVARYLHLIGGYSPVLASSATTLLVATCVDRRLGRVALCGSLAGMSGGHLTPTVSVAVALGATTSACYEVLLRINNLCSGIGGTAGATAFLATSLLARYRGVSGVGRKLRRGMWKGGPSDLAVAMVLYHALGAAIAILLRAASDDDAATADPVKATSVVGLLGALFLRNPAAALALYGGSFVGASAPSRLADGIVPGEKNARAARPQTAASLVASFAGAGAMAGLIHAASAHAGYWNGGWGGKVGLCAFAGCWAWRGVGNLAQFARQ